MKKAEFSEIFESHFGDRFELDSEVCMCEQRRACCLSTHAMPDTTYRKPLVGKQVLKNMKTKLKEKGKRLRFVKESNVFVLGNSECLDTDWTVFDSCAIWSQVGSYSYGRVAAQGVTNTSLLLSKEFFEAVRYEHGFIQGRSVVF